MSAVNDRENAAARIYLRELSSEDVTPEYLSWFKDERVTEFLEVRDLRREDVIEYIRVGRETRTYFMYAICLKQDGRHIGNLKIGPIDRKHMISDLVVIIGNTEYWGQGLATEAIVLGSRMAFEQHGIRKLTGGMYSTNVGSIKCYTKAGWVVEARLRGHYLLGGRTVDRVCVSCFNPKYFDATHTTGTVRSDAQ